MGVKRDWLHRVVDMSPEGVYRRRMRVIMRKRRAMQTTVVKKQDKRSNRRTARLPCCGKERRYCKCFQDDGGPQEMFSIGALKRQADVAKQSDMLTAKDPIDMSFISPLLDMQRISIHRFLFNAILFRMYSKKENMLPSNIFLAMQVSVHVQTGLVCKTSSRSSTQGRRPSGADCFILPL